MSYRHPMLIALAVVIGLFIGSFLNVVILRIPNGGSIVKPPSACPQCQAPIQPYDNLPVLSWLILRGKGRCCGEPISKRYPIIEALTGIIFGLVTWWVCRNAGSSWWPLQGHGYPHAAFWLALIAFVYLAAVGLALSVIDIDTKRLPSKIVIPSWFVAAILLAAAGFVAGNPGAVGRALLGGLAMWVFFRLQHAVYPKGMGYGDVRLAGFLGQYLGFLGWDVWFVGSFAGFFLGAIFGVIAIVTKGGSLKNSIPFGPYMVLGAWIGLIWGHAWVDAYFRLTGIR